MEYSPNKEAAAEYIRWSSQEDNFSEFMTVNQGYIQGVTPKWEDHSVWQSDPAIEIYATNPRYGRYPGYAGPWNRQSGEVQEKYIIVDMFARAARGEDPEEVAAWGQSELENVYGA
jgi:multiple sugar transport system substrate-binding protein